MLLFIYYNVVVIRCSLTLLETLLKCTDTYTKMDFLQLSSTFLGAKVVNMNLVSRYLTAPARGPRWIKSYSPFLCSHSNSNRCGMVFELEDDDWPESYIWLISMRSPNVNTLMPFDKMPFSNCVHRVRRGPRANLERQKFRLDVNKIRSCQQLIQRDLAALTSIFS